MTTWVLRICGILLGLGTLYGGWVGYRRDARFADHAARAVIAPVAGYDQTVTTTKQLGVTVDEQTRNGAFIGFKTATGRWMRVYMNLPDTVLSRITAGQPVSVEYLPEDPMQARFAGHTSGYGRLLLIGLLVVGFTAIFWRRA